MGYWSSLIIICYCPDFSKEVIDYLRENLSPSMEEEDGKAQYHIDTVSEELANLQLSERDLTIMLEARNQNVEYFEF